MPMPAFWPTTWSVLVLDPAERLLPPAHRAGDRTGVLLQVVKLALAGWLLPEPEKVLPLAAGQPLTGEPLQETALVLVKLLEMVVFVAAPLLAGLGVLAG